MSGKGARCESNNCLKKCLIRDYFSVPGTCPVWLRVPQSSITLAKSPLASYASSTKTSLHIDSEFGRLLSSQKGDFRPLDVHLYGQPSNGRMFAKRPCNGHFAGRSTAVHRILGTINNFFLFLFLSSQCSDSCENRMMIRYI